MNALLDQFVAEGRQLLEQASQSLLSLEADPAQAAHLDGLFRAVHTIKGASGLFEIAPFTRAVHAGEDLLDAVREGDVTFDADLADLLLNLLDQVAEWLAELEQTGALAEGADTLGDSLSEALRTRLADTGAALAPPAEMQTDPGQEWPAEIPAVLGAPGGEYHLLDYQPHEGAFFSGDDPLLTCLTLPGLLWLDPVPPQHWPAPAEMDPFQAVLGFRMLSSAPREELKAHCLYVEDQVRIDRLAPPPPATAAPLDDRTMIAQDLLTSQCRLIEAARNADQTPAGLAAARAALSRLARNLDQHEVAERLKHVAPDDAEAADQLRSLAETLQAHLIPAPAPALPEPPPAPATVTPKEESDTAALAARRPAPIRVDAERIDQLMNLAGELIVAKNAMPYLVRRAEETEDARSLAREIKAQHDVINRIADELQGAVMQIRMVPVGTVLGRFNRLVRDLSRKLEKRIRLDIEGEETEADKAVVEELADPMVHLIRNCIDHGLETPMERRAAGKPEEGMIRLKASQRDDSVVIEITDDGRGIDVARVREKAVAKGLIDATLAAEMGDEAALQLILMPGLSTRDEISDLSGRGVGMDVVASMVRRVGGTIALQSSPGKGTTVQVSLPLSMAVQRLMMIEVDKGLYGVAVEHVVESQRLPADRIHRHRDEEMVVLRDRMIPLLRLSRLFGCAPPEEQLDINVMVIDVDGNEVGLVVDKFHAGVDAIVKPMQGILSGVACFSGTALLGDGSVLLALNLSEILACRWK